MLSHYHSPLIEPGAKSESRLNTNQSQSGGDSAPTTGPNLVNPTDPDSLQSNLYNPTTISNSYQTNSSIYPHPNPSESRNSDSISISYNLSQFPTEIDDPDQSSDAPAMSIIDYNQLNPARIDSVIDSTIDPEPDSDGNNDSESDSSNGSRSIERSSNASDTHTGSGSGSNSGSGSGSRGNKRGRGVRQLAANGTGTDTDGDGDGDIETLPDTSNPIEFLKQKSNQSESKKRRRRLLGRSSRVGIEYQAIIEPFNPPLPIRNNTNIQQSIAIPTANPDPNIDSDPPIDGIRVWYGTNLIPELQSKVDEYLRLVETLHCYSSIPYSEETALEFLHHTNYDIESALNMVQPWIIGHCKPLSAIIASAAAGIGADIKSYPNKSILLTKAERDLSSINSNPTEACLCCGDGGEVFLCDYLGCKRVYHPECLGLLTVPRGLFKCPAHSCTICKSPVSDTCAQCVTCPNSYCICHLPSPANLNLSNNTTSNKRQLRRLMGRIELLDFQCPRCITIYKSDNNTSGSDRRIFLQVLQRIIEGRQLQSNQLNNANNNTANNNNNNNSNNNSSIIQLDSAAIYSTIKSAGGLNAVLSSSQWKKIFKQYEFQRLAKV